MPLVANIRGAPGADGVVGLFVAVFNKTWSLGKASSAVSYVNGATTVHINTAGWYSVNWKGATQYAVGASITLTAVNGECVIAGPLT